MRKIKFRGKRKSGKWTFGDLIHYNDGIVINDDFGHDSYVIDNTVGQFTGLFDEIREEIYEGDIVRCFDNKNNSYYKDLPVEYCELWCSFVAADKPYKKNYMLWRDFYRFKVIGNIHDNL